MPRYLLSIRSDLKLKFNFIMSLDFILRSLTILVFIIIRIYWYLTKKNAYFAKPKTRKKILRQEQIVIVFGALIALLNLLGFSIYTFENLNFQIFGFLLVILGSIEAIVGRATLGYNWTESYQFQIKQNHELIKKGIYSLVRHPIYGGFIFVATGIFIVAKTYLFIPVLFLQIITMTYFAKREEKLLGTYFGKDYLIYLKKTKMFIPLLF